MSELPYVLGITGASAQPLAERTIQLLLESNKSVHLVLSKGSYEVWASEKQITIPSDTYAQQNFWRDRLKTQKGNLVCHGYHDLSASIASGSYKSKAMVIIPCSMGTVGRIASGISSNLIERAADVHIKENRPLIICPRESPLSLIHLNNLTLLAKAGVRIVPPIPSWYSQPENIDEMIDFIIVRLFDSLGEELKEVRRWGK
tara:strand:+ start:181 stop:786 length:606 start_codon:yes stop_codon:yes gene_type:complete